MKIKERLSDGFLIVLLFLVPFSVSVYGSCGALSDKLIKKAKKEFISMMTKNPYIPCESCPPITRVGFSFGENNVFFDNFYSQVRVNGKTVACDLSELKDFLEKKVKTQSDLKVIKNVIKNIK